MPEQKPDQEELPAELWDWAQSTHLRKTWEHLCWFEGSSELSSLDNSETVWDNHDCCPAAMNSKDLGGRGAQEPDGHSEILCGDGTRFQKDPPAIWDWMVVSAQSQTHESCIHDGVPSMCGVSPEFLLVDLWTSSDMMCNKLALKKSQLLWTSSWTRLKLSKSPQSRRTVSHLLHGS